MADEPSAQPTDPSGGDDQASAIALRTLAAPALLLASVLVLTAGLVWAVMNRPDPDARPFLREAQRQLRDARYEDAIDTLNDKVAPLVDRDLVPPQYRAEFHRLRAEAISFGQELLEIDRAENHRAVLRDYERYDRIVGERPDRMLERIGIAQLGLRRVDDALGTLEEMEDADGEHARRLLRRIVEIDMDRIGAPLDRTLALLMRLRASPSAGPDERHWAVLRQAELRLRHGFAEEARRSLLLELQREENRDPERDARLRLLLGEAYSDLGRHDEAREQLRAAIAGLPENDPDRTVAEYMRARIDLRAGDIADALEGFRSVAGIGPTFEMHAGARFGLAEAFALEGDDQQSIPVFADVVGGVTDGEAQRHVTPDALKEALLRLHADRFIAGRLETALRYAQLAGRLPLTGSARAEVLMQIALTHRRLGERLATPPEGVTGPDALSPIQLTESKRHFLHAGDYYLQHADAVTLADVEAHRQSVWDAAEAYDRSGNVLEALAAYKRYVDTAPPSDPRRPEAMYKLGVAHRAAGHHADAARVFTELIERAAGQDPQKGVGPWATRSMTPLAMTYLEDNSPENDAEGEAMLRSVAEGGRLSPDAPEYRAALAALGEHLYLTDRRPEAIAVLTKALDLGAEDDRRAWLRYALADSYRLSAADLAEELRREMPFRQREQFTAQREERLRDAQAYYALVRDELESRDPRRLTSLERTILRNSWFFFGGCAYDLGDFDRAIQAYDSARQRYADDAASLVAMIQIVNAYVQQERWSEARTAQRRARAQLDRFEADEVEWSSLPMDWTYFENWLRSRDLLNAVGAEGG